MPVPVCDPHAALLTLTGSLAAALMTRVCGCRMSVHAGGAELLVYRVQGERRALSVRPPQADKRVRVSDSSSSRDFAMLCCFLADALCAVHARLEVVLAFDAPAPDALPAIQRLLAERSRWPNVVDVSATWPAPGGDAARPELRTLYRAAAHEEKPGL